MPRKAMYQKFYFDILNKIKTGELKSGEKLPTERALCEIYEISRTTVREGLKNLEIDGYVLRKQGSGNFVNVKPMQEKLTKLYTLRDMFSKQGIKHEVNIESFDIIKSNEEISEKLGLSLDEEVIKIVRTFSAANVPYTIEYTYLPRDLFPKITKEMISINGLYKTLEIYDKKPTSAVETIRAVKATAKQRRMLELPNDVLAMETKRVTCSDKIIIEYTKNIIRNDYFIYTVELN